VSRPNHVGSDRELLSKVSIPHNFLIPTVPVGTSVPTLRPHHRRDHTIPERRRSRAQCAAAKRCGPPAPTSGSVHPFRPLLIIPRAANSCTLPSVVRVGAGLTQIPSGITHLTPGSPPNCLLATLLPPHLSPYRPRLRCPDPSRPPCLRRLRAGLPPRPSQFRRTPYTQAGPPTPRPAGWRRRGELHRRRSRRRGLVRHGRRPLPLPAAL